ncbi:MAG: PD-(D/E)XK nuclease family protein [Planctomycetes bacterium]|nr:PD-(D/E)XK nuclease family protein [Planctomycetota bacterium]
MTTQVLPGTRTSYSRLSTWLRCPKKFKFRYVDAVDEERSSAAMLLGQAIHESCEAFFRSLPGGNPISLDEMLGVCSRALTDSAALAEEQGRAVDWGEGSLKDLLAKAETMLAVFHQQVDRSIHVIGTEVDFEAALAAGVIVQGVIDLILHDGNGHFRVVDLKTAASSFTEDRILHDLQPTVYIYAAETFLRAPGAVDFEYWVLTKTKTPALRIVPAVRDARDRAELVQTITEVEEACVRGVFPRIRGHNCLGCEYADRCNRT